MNLGLTMSDLRRLGFVPGEGNAWVKGGPPQAERQCKTVKAFLTVPIRSEANANGKLRDSLRRKRQQKEAIIEALGKDIAGRGQPKRVTFVLLSSQEQDDDNLARSFKTARDQIAELCGFDDVAKVWEYQQRKPFAYESRGFFVWIRW